MITKILAKTNDEKGNLFEELMGDVLDGVGYTDLEFNRMLPSGEFDITGRHKISGQEILVECKAEGKPIGKSDLQKFHSKYTVEYNKKSQGQPLVGLFFSLSGFANTALQYHNNLDEQEKTRFRLFGYKEILDILKDLKLIHSEETILHTVARRIPYSISRCYLVKSPSGLYWVVLFFTEGEETHSAIVDGKGDDIAVRRVCDEIVSLDSELKDKEMINLQTRRKVILCLLDCVAKTKKEIAEAINESLTDVGLELDRLCQENACDVEERDEATFYTLRKDIFPFSQLSREFLETEDRGKFANSEYYHTMIDERLVNFVENRFRLQITDGDREALRRILLLSPSALLHCLHGSTAYFDQSWSDLQRRNLSDSDRIRFTEVHHSRFLNDLLEELLSDMMDVEYGSLYHKMGIKAARTKIQLRLATLQKRYLDVVAGGLYFLAQAQGDLRGGQIVSYVNPEAFADDGLAYYHLGAFQEAIRNYDKALNVIKNPEKKAMVWNNKGLAYCSMNKHEKAIECYDEAIALDSEEKLKEARFNKGLCLSHLERYSEAIEWYEKALVIDPEDENVKSFLAEAKRMKLSKLSETTRIRDDELLEPPISETAMGEDITEPFRLCESNLTKLERRLLENNSKELVDDFMKTLRYALLSTVAIKGDQIDKIILRGGILKDTTNLSDPFSLDIELFIILNIESYSLAEIIVELADNIYGDILDKKRILFINTILSQTEWNNIISDQDEYLILVEKGRVLQNSLHQHQQSAS